MQGVIIWYSRTDFQAIIWCEDSKDLGIAIGPTAWRNPMAMVEVGDVVTFSHAAAPHGRRCTDVHLVSPAAAPDLHRAIAKANNCAAPGRNRLLHLCATPD